MIHWIWCENSIIWDFLWIQKITFICDICVVPFWAIDEKIWAWKCDGVDLPLSNFGKKESWFFLKIIFSIYTQIRFRFLKIFLFVIVYISQHSNTYPMLCLLCLFKLWLILVNYLIQFHFLIIFLAYQFNFNTLFVIIIFLNLILLNKIKFIINWNCNWKKNSKIVLIYEL